MFAVRKGATRTVILTKRYAFKFPAFYNWKQFWLGMADNITEWEWRGMAAKPECQLCPPIWGTKIGFLLIMPRCTPVNHVGLYYLELERLCSLSPKQTGIAPEFYLNDAKPSNFGYLNGRMVKLDYAGGR